MACFRKVGRWASRHKIPLTITAVGVGAFGYYVYKRTTSFVEDFTKDFSNLLPELNQKQQYFESIPYAATIKSDLHLLRKCINEEIPLPTQEEMEKGTAAENKKQFWEDLKLLYFTRLFVIIYSQVIFSVCMRLQLTIVAKYIFLQSESENSFEIDAETNLNFLKLARHITSNGLIPLRNNLECIVSEILTNYPIGYSLGYNDVINIISNVRNRFELNEDDIFTLSKYMLPETIEHSQNETSHLLENETRNILETKLFEESLKDCTDSAFCILTSQINGYFEKKRTDENLTDISQCKVFMARFLSTVRNIVMTLEDDNNDVLQSTFESEKIEYLMNEIYDATINAH